LEGLNNPVTQLHMAKPRSGGKATKRNYPFAPNWEW